MKPIITTFAGLVLAASVALAGSAATAGSVKIHKKSGISHSQHHKVSRFGNPVRDRSWGRRHELHFGSPFIGTYGKYGVYTKEVRDDLIRKSSKSRKH